MPDTAPPPAQPRQLTARPLPRRIFFNNVRQADPNPTWEIERVRSHLAARNSDILTAALHETTDAGFRDFHFTRSIGYKS